ncbi:hypothetical protein ABZ370_31785 [Streptomyces sp. NPDC005962]|uniref:hypothetical protein n=1 Tax=Streptomyces sp. NPDC005962 TaxID=3154466 RepID=UPI00340B86E2
MAFIDHHDVFVGSTTDGHTFVALNGDLPAAHRILTRNGFTAREHQGRALYLLPPTSAQEAHHQTGQALYELLPHTMDFADLSWTTRWLDSGPLPETGARFDLSDGRVTATADTDAARQVLEQHGFQRTPTGYALPGEISERESVGIVTRTEIHLWALGHGVKVSLGFPTPDAIPPAPSRASAPAPAQPPQPTTSKRRTR